MRLLSTRGYGVESPPMDLILDFASFFPGGDSQGGRLNPPPISSRLWHEELPWWHAVG